MFEDIPRFVPQDICLKCDGCCRFAEADSVWRPRAGKDELPDHRGEVDPQGRVATQKVKGEYLCRFFNAADHRCLIYVRRPLECRLYPFMIAAGDRGPAVYAHLSCPHVQEHYGTEAFQTYTDELKIFFRNTGIRAFVAANYQPADDYAAWKDELAFLFTIGKEI